MVSDAAAGTQMTAPALGITLGGGGVTALVAGGVNNALSRPRAGLGLLTAGALAVACGGGIGGVLGIAPAMGVNALRSDPPGKGD